LFDAWRFLDTIMMHRLTFIFCLAAIGSAGCGQQEIRVYRIPKEPVAAHEPHNRQQPQTQDNRPVLVWKTPASWKENPPSQFRVASFTATGADGKQQADISAIPLPGGAGGDLNNVNRWRGQVGLAPVTEQEFANLGEPVTVAGSAARLFDMDGASADGVPSRILAVIQHRDNVAWFYKMTGDSALVGKEKTAFIDFLKSLVFSTSTGHAHHDRDHDAGPTGKPSWSAPAGWKSVDGAQFLAAKFEVAGANNAQATVNVSTSVGDGGGLLANVNRWRAQLGLAPVSEADLATLAVPVSADNGKAVMVEFSGERSALVAVAVTLPGESWFYKLMGDPALVAGQKQAFIQFVQGVKY
jgi:hypothetical protein